MCPQEEEVMGQTTWLKLFLDLELCLLITSVAVSVKHSVLEPGGKGKENNLSLPVQRPHLYKTAK